jgi:hypothetical protein
MQDAKKMEQLQMMQFGKDWITESRRVAVGTGGSRLTEESGGQPKIKSSLGQKNKILSRPISAVFFV